MTTKNTDITTSKIVKLISVTLLLVLSVFFVVYFICSGILNKLTETPSVSVHASVDSSLNNWWSDDVNLELCCVPLFEQCLNLTSQTDFMYVPENNVSIIVEEVPDDYASHTIQPETDKNKAVIKADSQPTTADFKVAYSSASIIQFDADSPFTKVFYEQLNKVYKPFKLPSTQPYNQHNNIAEALKKDDSNTTVEADNSHVLSHADIDDLPQETVDKIYEEKLPTDVIIEDADEDIVTPEMLADGYHVYHHHHDVKNLNIIPRYKPAYFGDKPVVVVVIDDMGISQKRSQDIISLHQPLTASFLTYGKNLDQQVSNAEQAGMEVMLHAAMEPHSKADLAPDTLTTAMTSEQVKQGLSVMIGKLKKINGINNHMGSKLTEDWQRMNAVMEVLKQKDLFFLDSKTSAFSVAKKAARLHGVPYVSRHVFLDNENKVPYIMQQLAIVERIAKRNGYAIAIGHPKTATYQALKQWLPTLDAKNLQLKHLSDIVDVVRKSHK